MKIIREVGECIAIIIASLPIPGLIFGVSESFRYGVVAYLAAFTIAAIISVGYGYVLAAIVDHLEPDCQRPPQRI